jgi:hypothetical protein
MNTLGWYLIEWPWHHPIFMEDVVFIVGLLAVLGVVLKFLGDGIAAIDAALGHPRNKK